ncbi:MAG: hypothetical protein K2K39_02825 [Clostridia bacterium]|nr:hypothetical protein [Clostridia bacterium]
MNTLNLTVNKALKGSRVYVDGKQIALKRNKDGSFAGTYTTDSSEAEVAVVKLSEVGGRLWFLWAMLFFVISCFGLFNAHYDRRCRTVSYRAVVKLNEVSNVRLEFNAFADGQRAAEFGSDCPIGISENIYGVDKQAKKRFKIISLVEALVWIALIISAAVLVVKLIIG